MYLILTLPAFLCIIAGSFQTQREDKSWLNNIIKYISEDSKIHQVLLIVNNSQDSKVVQITKTILRSVPTRKITFSECNIENAKALSNTPIFSNPRSSLFILIYISKENFNSFINEMDFISEISPARIRPKCLIICLHQRKIILQKEMLHHAWSRHFLDFTILELIQENTTNNILVNIDNFQLMIHYYNPFTEDYITKNSSDIASTDLFPKKLLDMNGHKMKVGSFKSPPYVYLNRNSTKHPVDVYGSHVRLIKTLSEVMNFVTLEVPSKFDNWGNFHIEKNKTSNLVHKLVYNEIQLITNQGVMVYRNRHKFNEDTNYVGITRLCPLVPILTNKSQLILINTAFIYMILIIGLLNLLSFVLFRFLKFDHFWSLPHILEIILGMPVSQSPQKSAARIIFGFILIASFLFNSTTYYIFANITLISDKELEIKTLDDLDNSGLELWMPRNARSWFYYNNDTDIESLLTKSVTVSSYYVCIKYIVKHKNISCVLMESLAQYAINKYRNPENNEPVMKIAGQCFGEIRENIYFEPHSPYVERVDEILSRMHQAGLISFNVSSFKKVKNFDELKVQEATKIQRPLIIILVSGYISSISVFICEVIVNYLCRRY